MADGAPAHPTLATVARLLRLGGFRHFFVTRLVSQLGDGIFQLAAADLLLFKHPGTNPAWTLTKLSAITLVPFSMIVPFVGVFIDRWNRRTILVATPLGRAGLIALVPLATRGTADRPAFYVIVLLILSANRLFLATLSAVLPSLVAEQDLLVANSLATTGGSIANVIGLGIGAGLSAIIGGTKAGIIGGAAFLTAAVIARAIPIRAGEPNVEVSLGSALARVLHEMAEGVRRVRGSARASFALASISAMQVLIGASVAATAVVYIVRMHLGVGSVSGLLSVLAVGVFTGVVTVPAAARRLAEERLPSVGFVIGGLATIATGIAVGASGVVDGHASGAGLARGALMAGALFAGIAFAFAKIPVDTMVQEALPDSYRGRAFASYDMLYNIARVAGTAAAAWLVAVGVREPAIVLGVGVAYLGAAAITARRALRLGDRRVGRAPRDVETNSEPRRSPVPIGELVTVRAYAGYRADQEPRAILIGDRELAIDAVDWRSVEERGGRRRRVFAIRVMGQRLRLAYDEESDRWEVERAIRTAEP